MNISLFHDWLEERLFGEGGLASLMTDIVDDAMARSAPCDPHPSERAEQVLLAEAWEAARNESELVRARTAVVLGRLGHSPVEPALEEAMRSEDPIVASAAAIVLARLRGVDERTFSALAATIKNPAHPRELRSSAARTLASGKTPATVKTLVNIAESDDPDLAQYGLEGLGCVSAPAGTGEHELVLKTLLAGLASKDVELKVSAAEALGNFGDRAAVKELETVLLEKDASLRRRVLFSLAKMGAESARAPLARMMRDFSVPARWEIIDVAGECYGESMIDALALAARDRDAELHDHVVAALAKMDGPASIELLRKIALENADDFVREQVMSALAARGAELHPRPAVEPVAPAVPSAPEPPPPPQSASAALQPLYSGLAPPSAPFGEGRQESVVERALESLACKWRLEPDGYKVTVPAAGGDENAAILLGEADYEESPVYRFIVNCGPADSRAYETALRNNRALEYGSVAIEDTAAGPCFVLTDTLPAAGATVAGVRKTLTSLVRSARRLRARP